MGALHLAVLLAAGWTVLAMAGLAWRARGYGRRRLFSKPAGDPRQGVRYAFIQGMAPWAKESVRDNPGAYGAGMAFHAGVFAAFGLLVLALCGWTLPAALALPARLLTLAGAVAGYGLLLKRISHAELRGLSSPDDYLSNLLTASFALLACGASLDPGLVRPWLLETVLLLAYAPLGKIRHCLFFFATRSAFGTFFGRRGTYPPGGSAHA